jgi:Protein of unknown function (DUF2891)
MDVLDAAAAARFAGIALTNVACEYPNKPDHVVGSAGDVQSQRAQHPVFYGSFDWHSCVHMHWLLARLRRLFPALPQRDAIALVFDRHFTRDAIAGEIAYLARPEAQSFERTYGWAWLLKLTEELIKLGDDAGRWSEAMAPLADAFVARYLDYLPRAQYPWRYGLHANSAFGLAFALDYARAAGEHALEALCVTKARAWFGNDRDAPAAWEPSGADFLSPTLIEAELMRRIEDPVAFGAWLAALLPGFVRREPAMLFTPAEVSDRSDGHIVHLDGLNLSRAWCFRGIAATLHDADPRTPIAAAAARVHLAAGLAGLDSGEYAGAHWLATFATLALTADPMAAAKLRP